LYLCMYNKTMNCKNKQGHREILIGKKECYLYTYCSNIKEVNKIGKQRIKTFLTKLT
jgi:hypothetical protein